MSESPLFLILNSNAGRGTGAQRLETLRKNLTDADRLVECFSPSDVPALVREAQASGFRRIVAVGGDGTLSSVAKHLVHHDFELALVPSGTGNDLARHYKIPFDPIQALKLARSGLARPHDVIRLGQDDWLLNVLACGFDAKVGERVNEGYRWAKGTLAYLVAVLQTLSRFEPFDVEAIVDGQPKSFRACVLAVANLSSYGGGMKIAPKADGTDGLMDVVIIGDVSKFELIREFPKVFKGAHLNHPKVQAFKCQKIEVRTSPAMPVLNDGESISPTPFAAEVVSGGLSLVLPELG